MECKWINKTTGTQCKNLILMDEYCSRHLKQVCSICFEKVPSTNSAKTKRLSCGHSYHLNCILSWFVNSECCPICRKEQIKDPIILFKKKVEDEIREKYRDAITTYEYEIHRLRRNNPRRI
jgi:hypothetical protein